MEDRDPAPEPAEEAPSFEMTAEEATSLAGPSPAANFFDRRKVLTVLSLVFVGIVSGGVILNMARSGKKAAGDETQGGSYAAQSPEFLRSQRDRALQGRAGDGAAGETPSAPPQAPPGAPSAIPPAYDPQSPAGEFTRPAPPHSQRPPPPPQGQAGGGGGGGADPRRSPLVPRAVEGSLFGGSAPAAAPGRSPGSSPAERYPYLPPGQGRDAAQEYLESLAAARQPQAAAPPSPAESLYDPGAGGGAAGEGRFLGDGAIWIGTIIPGVLETAISTDLPGNVIARVTRNVFDSRTGRHLLIPQGTLLVARYSSSVSYAQRRVQIVWDTLIRPDGYQADLGGMNGVDRRGMSGQEAVYHENWFEYLKAAGLVAMFSAANAKMTEEAASRAASPDAASAIAQANAGFVAQTGGTIVSRALDIQPTLTVDSGTRVNIMLNRTVYLPPVPGRPPAGPHILE